MSRYPDTPNVHYAYGVFLLAEQPDKGDRGLPARAEGVAAERLREAADRLRLHPHAASTRRRCRGRRRRSPRRRPSSWRATRSARRCSRPDDVAAAIRELEAGVKLAPGQPDHALRARPRVPARRPDRRRREGAAGVPPAGPLSARPAPAAESIGGIPLDAPPRRSRNPIDDRREPNPSSLLPNRPGSAPPARHAGGPAAARAARHRGRGDQGHRHRGGRGRPRQAGQPGARS